MPGESRLLVAMPKDQSRTYTPPPIAPAWHTVGHSPDPNGALFDTDKQRRKCTHVDGTH